MATLNSSKNSWLVTLALVAAAGGWYWWLARTYNGPFEFGKDLGGYYNYLARGFAKRSLAVPLSPDPRLLAASDPYDPQLPDEWRMHDMALYRGRYFLYHGPVPAALFLLPWRWATRHDLPEPVLAVGLALIAFAANLASLRKLNPKASLLARAALGFGGSIPFLLHRIWVYEVAILAGLAFASLAVCAYLHGARLATGALLGLAFLSRPHLLLVGLFLRPDRGMALGLAPFLAVSALYNWARFDSPLEFGFHYLLSGPGQQAPQFSFTNVLPSLYAFVLHPPQWSARFPWLELTAGYGKFRPQAPFVENVLGAVWLAPSLLVSRSWHRPLAGAAVALLLFLSTTGWVTQRYVVDFLPLLLLASLRQENRATGPLLALGILVNTGAALLGPYNQP